MSSLSPFQIGQQVSKNFAPMIEQQKDTGAIEDIFAQVQEREDSGQGGGFDDLMGQIMQRVSPKNQKAAIGILEGKKKQIQTQQKGEAFKRMGLDPSIAQLEPSVQREIVKAHQDKSKNKQEQFKAALDRVKKQKQLLKTGDLGPYLGYGQRKGFGPLDKDARRNRAEYEQLGKSLISMATNIPIRNRVEFETLAGKLIDPSLDSSEIEGTLNAMESIIRSSLQNESLPQESISETVSETVSETDTQTVNEGTTATGPNGQKLVRRGGKWLPV